ncbi:MAG TPA: carbohydrate kinase [Draconibacterium sp.]|nr:carbohydrate kinase [Draconibacterium sp.]
MSKNSYRNILCFGEVLWDMLPSGAKPGGAPLNVAIHLIRQGQKPKLISKTGKDKLGFDLVQFIAEAGLEQSLIQADELLPTSQVIIHLDKFKNATYEICEPVAWDNIQLTRENLEAVEQADLVIFGSLALRNKTSRETLLHLLENTKATRLLDVNLRPPYDYHDVINEMLKKADFIKLNNDELIIIAGWHKQKGTETELIHWISKFFICPAVCVTRGENGAALFLENTLYEHPGFKVKAVDTVGAGDSFLASLIANLSKNVSPQMALKYACATGAFVASQNGAVPVYTEKEIKKIINKGT